MVQVKVQVHQQRQDLVVQHARSSSSLAAATATTVINTAVITTIAMKLMYILGADSV